MLNPLLTSVPNFGSGGNPLYSNQLSFDSNEQIKKVSMQSLYTKKQYKRMIKRL